MPKLKYVGTSNTRGISSASWDSVGIEQGDTEWDREAGTELDVSQQAADFLNKTEPGAFTVVDGEFSDNVDVEYTTGDVAAPTTNPPEPPDLAPDPTTTATTPRAGGRHNT